MPSRAGLNECKCTNVNGTQPPPPLHRRRRVTHYMELASPLRGASENFDASDVPEFHATGDLSMAILACVQECAKDLSWPGWPCGWIHAWVCAGLTYYYLRCRHVDVDCVAVTQSSCAANELAFDWWWCRPA